VEIKREPLIIAGQNKGYAKGTAVIGARGTVYLSGAVGIDPATGEVPEAIGEQTQLALEAIKARLQEYGSELKYIMHIWCYMKGRFPDSIHNAPGTKEYVRVKNEFWREHCPEFLRQNSPPASTMLGVTALALPEYKLEIQVVAAIP